MLSALASTFASDVIADSGDLAEADALYARRAEGSTSASANPQTIDKAIALYRRAVRESPQGAEALAGLLRALHFRGAFCGASVEERKALFEEAKTLGQAAVDLWEKPLAGQSPAVRLAALRARRGAVGVYFWTAAAWGQWALTRGKFAAARQGVATKVRDLGETVIAIDRRFEEGGGHRILGRLHHQAPKIPLLTGWVSKQKAVEYLRQSFAVEPRNTATRFFLAVAILDHDETHAAEARELLRSCADDPPRGAFLVEDRFYADEARALLKRLR